MSLTTYNKKRDFSQTAEPKGKEAKDGKQLIFVVQRHDASHLHYDFRLELDGVLKSWAVPKGPSLYPKDRRLAVQVEDHPIPYARFEGDIPAGNYGAGHVDIWDNGTYQPVDDKGSPLSHSAFAKALEEGSIRFIMNGKKLQGEFKLFRMHDGDKNWLLMKSKDEAAIDEPYDIESHRGKVTKAPKKKVKADAPATAIEPEANPKKFTGYIRPMMAKLTDEAFNDEHWLFEIKWDGYRAIAELDGKEKRLYSRNGLSFEESYPAIFKELDKIKKRVVLDGEIVAFDEKGNPDFQMLQNHGSESASLCYYVFDCLSVNGKSIEDKPLTERKEILKELLPKSDLIRYCDHVTEKGKDFFAVMEKQGLEGMIAKKANSVYEEGSRSGDWLKVKHIITDEAIICGYTAPKGTREYFGALLLGMYQDGKLTYIGHTGTGFTRKTLKELYNTMQPYKADESPFEGKVHPNDVVTWLRPELVCAVKYSEITNDGQRRHPVFMDLRTDKSAPEVNGADRADNASGKPTIKKAKSPKEEDMEGTITVGKQKVTLTNTGKVFWPDEGYTKGDVIAYYDTVSKYILPYLKGRPMSLKRNPNGIADRGFFHKDAGDTAPDWVNTESIHSDSTGKEVEYILCNNKATLLYLANLGCIELNPWHSRVGHLEKPDYLLMDIDPSEKNTFDQVMEAAKTIKEILDKAGAPAYCKTSGSTGIHIYVPMGAKYTYEQVNAFAEIVATQTVDMLPDFTSIERSLKKRGKDAIYIDYMQNNIAQTVAAPYSLRPKPHAPVSTPLDWKELRKGLTIEQFNIKNTPKRLEKLGDLFKPVLGKGIDMAKCLKKLGA